jgi:signal transduction histidine kinase
LFLFHYFFKKFILNPLNTLTSSIKKADFSQTSPVALKTNDEFETLAETFNALHGKLKKASSNLVELNEKLEEKVDIRTAELSRINKELSKEIDEHRLTSEKLREARDQAEAASIAKSQFLANISHELRTPMHGILSFVTLGLSKIDTLKRVKIKQFLGEIHSSAHRLLNLLNDLLDLSRLESGKEKYIFEEHHLSPVVTKAITEMSAFQKDKHIHVLFDEPNFDDRALFDGAKITQVLQNLISNAIKFSSDHGKIRLSISESGPDILLSVADNGVGIPKDELESVFDKFVQSSKTVTGAGGTGLGLSICRKIIGDHQGKIWAENNPEGGTILKFKIPKRI